MNIPRVLLVGATLGIIAAVGSLAPAAASTGTVNTPTSVSVSGETWSAPSYPVTCRQSSNQITCTPDAASQVEAQECFLGVAIDGARATVCTTYDGHKSELQAAGGKLTLVAYGCSLGDAVCVTFENAGRGMALGTTAMMFAVSDAMRFDTSTTLWDAAAGEWSFWNWAVLIIVFTAMVWSIAAAAVSGAAANWSERSSAPSSQSPPSPSPCGSPAMF